VTTNLFARYAAWLLRHRRAMTVLLIAATGLAVWSARRVYLRFAFTDFYEYPGNPDVPILEQYYEDFGDPAGFVVLLVEADDVFQRPVLEYIDAATRALMPSPAFARVRSLTNAKAIYGSEGEVTSGPLMTTLPASAEERERLRRVAVQSRLLVDRLVSADSTTTVILAELAHHGGTFDEGEAAIAAAKQAVAGVALPPGVTMQVTGAPVVDSEMSATMVGDQIIFVPMVVLLIMITTYLIFRSVHAVIMLAGAILVALLWGLGVWPSLDRPIDMISSTFPAILLVYGAVDPIFVVSRYLTKLEAGLPRDEAIVATFSEIGLPCLLTSVTTALGFMTYAMLDLPTLVAFGTVLAAGVMFAFVTTMTVLPLLLSVMPLRPKARTGANLDRWIDRRLVTLAAWLRRHGRPLVVGAMVLLVAGGIYAARQEPSVLYVGTLPPGRTLDGVRTLERKLSGVTRMSVLLEGPPGSMKRPEVLRAIEAIDAEAERHDIVRSSVSLADLLKELNVAFNGGDEQSRRLPSSRTLAAQYLALLDPEDLSDFADAELSRTHIRVLNEDRGSAAWRPLEADLEARIARELTGLDVKATLTGASAVIFPVLDRMVVEIVIGFGLGFAIIVLVQMLVFRSWRIALLGILPNLLPAVACFVLLKLTTTLRIGTSLPLCAAIGGLFNTTIHMAARALQRAREGGATPDEIVEHVLRKVAPPSLFTAGILSLGFAIFFLSRFPDLKQFGVLTMTVLLVGVIADVLITPVLLRRWLPWTRLTRSSGGPKEPAVEMKVEKAA
jgi:predicted RND superfamily exporter protein